MSPPGGPTGGNAVAAQIDNCAQRASGRIRDRGAPREGGRGFSPGSWLAMHRWSLRRKLIVACVLVELGAMLLVLLAGSRVMQDTLQNQAAAQSRQIVAVLDQALNVPLVQRDFAMAQQILDRVRDSRSIPYLVLFDHQGRQVAGSGWDRAQPLPPVDIGPIDLDRDDAIVHMAAPIRLKGHDIARLKLGLSTEQLRMARDAFRATGLFIAALALAVSVGLLAMISHALTRNLATVSAASRRLAAGEFDVEVPVQTHDEVGLLAASFNRMAATIQERLAALQESRRQQHVHLVAARDERSRLEHLDPLTGLLNRHGLFDTLHAAIGRAAQANAGLTLIAIDLDDFQHANDVAGHRAGDQILVMVAELLSSQLEPDMALARMGGDEFTIVVPGNDGERSASLATRLVQSISAMRFERDALRLRIGCSIGVAVYPTDAGSADQLVACADRAMFQAKVGGKNGYCRYQDSAAHSQAEFDRVAWNGRIHGALRDHRLQLQFQPVHRVSDLGIVYYEALVRMVDEDDASHLIGPTAFVPHAERSGKIRQIDRWVFQACIDKLVQSPSTVCIAANLSARSLDDPTFVGFLREALQRCNVDPRRLHIELTETAAMGDLIAARPMISALRSVGCAVHLDDFGSGFSSFAHLTLLEVDGIKIDGSFVRDLTSDPSNKLVVSSLIKIARSLNKTTVAECVEDAATLDALRELGVDHVQGFHLGRPAGKLAERELTGR